MPTLKEKFEAWASQNVNELPPTGVQYGSVPLLAPTGGSFGVSGDCRMRPQGEIADAVINASDPALSSVPVQFVFDIVEEIKKGYTSTSPGAAALEAAKAIFHKLYSPDPVRIERTLIVLDILYKNAGIIFVNAFAIHVHLFRNFIERKETTQANVELAMRLVAEWQTVEVDKTYPLLKGSSDPLIKIHLLFDNMVKANYPFTEKHLLGIPQDRLNKLKKRGFSFGISDPTVSFSTYKDGFHTA
ncbi:hypothetical protein HDU99_001106 [Rhizoclosmatium hyalinum]|nr:hypothetical protein HDU99_001106 [Rhizoclosmatium hyalinum]